MTTTTIKELDEPLYWFNGVKALNFVETMTLYRAFTVGRFKCSGASTKIIADEFLSHGYTLAIRKDSTRKLCVSCLGDFFGKKGLRLVESENYLTIHAH